MIVASRSDTKPAARLTALGGQRVGTVPGYRYPKLDRLMGESFLRDDAATDVINTNKLLNKRFDYMVSITLYNDYQRNTHRVRAQLNRTVLTIFPFDTYCALPAKGRIGLDKVNRPSLRCAGAATCRQSTTITARHSSPEGFA